MYDTTWHEGTIVDFDITTLNYGISFDEGDYSTISPSPLSHNILFPRLH
jgi:hypothetical protein